MAITATMVVRRASTGEAPVIATIGIAGNSRRPEGSMAHNRDKAAGSRRRVFHWGNKVVREFQSAQSF